jgi:dihydrodipicolinate synthase
VNPIPVKAAMKLLGYDVGGLRLPLTELEDANCARLKESMESLKEN